MLAKLSVVALAALPFVNALTLHIPQNPTSQGTITITWDYVPGDPETFSLELINEAFNDAFAIANNVDTLAGEITLTLGVVPARDGYTLEAVNIGNINDVYSSTGPFSIGAATQTIPTTPLSTSTTGTGSSTRTGTGTTTTGTGLTTGTTSANTGRPTTTSPPATTGSSTTVQNAPATTNLAGGALSNYGVGVLSATLASLIGAAVLAL